MRLPSVPVSDGQKSALRHALTGFVASVIVILAPSLLSLELSNPYVQTVVLGLIAGIIRWAERRVTDASKGSPEAPQG
jgi:hypothetical protein